MTKGGEKSLWDIAVDRSKDQEDEQKAEESTVFFLGSKNAGKTSMILRFLDRDEAPKPTVALEYTFGRRAKGHNLYLSHSGTSMLKAKDVGHIWELGGGVWLSKLINVPIDPERLSNLTVALVLDLSQPSELWYTLETFLQLLRANIETAIATARRSDPNIKNRLKEKTWERIGEDHPDKDLMDPFLIPFIIIGSKYDLFQDFDSEKRKVICKTLRFVAHIHGAHLQFFSTKQEALMGRARTIVSHHLFGTNASKTLQVDHNKPIFSPPGLDSLQAIEHKLGYIFPGLKRSIRHGSPPLPDGDLGRMTAKTPMELWKAAFTSFFPQENVSDPSQVEDPAKDAQYKEHSIDSCRLTKDEELERYRKLAERRAKEAQRQM